MKNPKKNPKTPNIIKRFKPKNPITQKPNNPKTPTSANPVYIVHCILIILYLLK